ncbi:MAG TPA: hypothetical protein VEI49_02165, partial [Terriglobales bacterium]|nr:hypothetical protein [Terriglobales bacterium]
MTRLTLFVAMVLASLISPANAQQAAAAPDSYKPILDRLQSLGTVPLPDWRVHTDVAHPEDFSVDDNSWDIAHPGQSWKGVRVLRRWIKIPDKVNGYAVENARVMLDLRF